MQDIKIFGLLGLLSMVICMISGCVERKLTIVTNPPEAIVWLNDEEIGTTPVSVNFKWYGDYRVRIEKSGCATINTHQELKRPLHDRFPFDFFAECLWPGRIVDTYTWNYDLSPFVTPSSDDLIKAAEQARSSFQKDIDSATQQINAVQHEKPTAD